MGLANWKQMNPAVFQMSKRTTLKQGGGEGGTGIQEIYKDSIWAHTLILDGVLRTAKCPELFL